jgi:hypothetical protein
MNQKFIKVVCIIGTMTSALVFSSVKAEAAGFHEGLNNSGIAISATKFNEVLANTNTEQLGYHFGAPDEIQALKDTFGTRVGSVWVYHNAVQKDGSKQDAHFVIINGNLQYATLSDAS